MKQNQQFRGLGLVLLVIALIMFASSLTSQGSLFSQEMTHQEFMVAVENKTIESVDINQNQQPPTGFLPQQIRGHRNTEERQRCRRFDDSTCERRESL